MCDIMYFRYFLVVLFCTSNWNIVRSKDHGIDNGFSSTLRVTSENQSVDKEKIPVNPVPISKPSACSSISSLVIINNLRSGIISTISMEKLNTLKLSEVRKMLTAKGYMDETELFFQNVKSNFISTIHKKSEKEIDVCAILNEVKDDKYFLSIGHQIIHPKQQFTNRFLHGIIIDKNGEFKVSDEITHRIAVFTDNNLPTIQSIEKLEIVNTLSSTTESHENEKTFSIGASAEASVNFGRVRKSASADKIFPNAQDSKQEKQSVHITSRVLNLKERITFDKNKIISSDWFQENVFSILLSSNETRVVGARLINFLNKYGWYIPVDYVVGGAISKSTVRDKITIEDASKVAMSIGNEIKEKIASIRREEGSNRVNYSSSANTRDGSINESSQDIFTSFGAGGALSIEDFQQKIENNKNWIVLQYNELIPSLRLLHNNYAYQYDQIHRLFLHMYTIYDLGRLQPFINFNKYASELVVFSDG